MPFRMILRVRDKSTHRTYLGRWPAQDGLVICATTGHKRMNVRAGYTEFNDRGEPVLDSWIEPTQYVIVHG